MRCLACLILVAWNGMIAAFELPPGFSVRSINYQSSIIFPVWPGHKQVDDRRFNIHLIHPLNMEINGTRCSIMGLSRASWTALTTDAGESLTLLQPIDVRTCRRVGSVIRTIGNKQVEEEIPYFSFDLSITPPSRPCAHLDISGTVVARRAVKAAEQVVLVMGAKETAAGTAVTFANIPDAGIVIEHILPQEIRLRMPESTYQRLEGLSAKFPGSSNVRRNWNVYFHGNGMSAVTMQLAPKEELTISLCPKIEEIEISVQLNDIPLPLPGVPLQMPVKAP